jgi:hypothetical protein
MREKYSYRRYENLSKNMNKNTINIIKYLLNVNNVTVGCLSDPLTEFIFLMTSIK